MQGGINEIYFKKIRFKWNNHLNSKDSKVYEIFCPPSKKGNTGRCKINKCLAPHFYAYSRDGYI